MRTDRITVYRAEDGWRWNYRASNGRVRADGGQGYSRRIDCIHGMEDVLAGVFDPAHDGRPARLLRERGDYIVPIPVVIEP